MQKGQGLRGQGDSKNDNDNDGDGENDSDDGSDGFIFEHGLDGYADFTDSCYVLWAMSNNPKRTS